MEGTPQKKTSVELAKIAMILNLTERRVNQLAKEGIIPRPARGQYEVIPCVHAYIKYLQAMANDGSLSLTDERTRLTRAQAEKAELDLKVAKGELLHAETAAKIWERIITSCRARIRSIPTKAAPLVFACGTIPEVKEELETQINEALSELSSIDPADHTKDFGGSKDMGPAAKVDSQPVGRRSKKTQRGGVGRTGTVADLKV